MPPDPAFEPHDHSQCRMAILAGASRAAADAGWRLTPIRQQVLEILAESHHALGAYQLLDRLVEMGHPRQPPLVYRALDFLCLHGLAHRIARLNAYIACRAPGVAHTPSFLICRRCDRVAEAMAPAISDAVSAMARPRGFRPDPVGVEATGLCPLCAPPHPETGPAA